MKNVYKKIIKAMCDCDMNIGKASKALFLSRNTVAYHVEKITKEYGLDPRHFRDLILLEQMADESIEEQKVEKEKKFCAWCGEEITVRMRRRYCSSECSQKYWNKVHPSAIRNITHKNHEVSVEKNKGLRRN